MAKHEGPKKVKRPIDPRSIPIEVWNQGMAFLNAIPPENRFPDPDPALVRKRMAEMRDLGFEDIPAVKGMSSSVRQYVITSLAMPPGQKLVFGTLDESLLARADELYRKYKLRPVNARVILEQNR